MCMHFLFIDVPMTGTMKCALIPWCSEMKKSRYHFLGVQQHYRSIIEKMSERKCSPIYIAIELSEQRLKLANHQEVGVNSTSTGREPRDSLVMKTDQEASGFCLI